MKNNTKNQLLNLLIQLKSSMSSSTTPNYIFDRIDTTIDKVANNKQTPSIEARVLYQNIQTLALDSEFKLTDHSKKILNEINTLANHQGAWEQIKNLGLTVNTWPGH